MKRIKYVLFVSTMAAILYGVELMRKHTEPLALNGLAMEPVIHLVNSSDYYRAGEPDRAIEELEHAIRKTMILREEVRYKNSLNLIDRGLPIMVNLMNERHAMSEEKLNQSCANMFIALAYMQVYSAKISLQDRNTVDMKESLSKAMYILKEVLTVTNGDSYTSGIAIYSNLSELKKREIQNSKEFITELDSILEELQLVEITLIDDYRLSSNF